MRPQDAAQSPAARGCGGEQRKSAHEAAACTAGTQDARPARIKIDARTWPAARDAPRHRGRIEARRCGAASPAMARRVRPRAPARRAPHASAPALLPLQAAQARRRVSGAPAFTAQPLGGRSTHQEPCTRERSQAARTPRHGKPSTALLSAASRTSCRPCSRLAAMQHAEGVDTPLALLLLLCCNVQQRVKRQEALGLCRRTQPRRGSHLSELALVVLQAVGDDGRHLVHRRPRAAAAAAAAAARLRDHDQL